MATFQAVLKDGAIEVIDDADTYAQEGPMTTFFRTEGGRGVIDAWATRVASVRTAEVTLIRRSPAALATVTPLTAVG